MVVIIWASGSCVTKEDPMTFSPSMYFVKGWLQFILQHVRIPCTGYCNPTSVTFRQGLGNPKTLLASVLQVMATM
jgi:hypothetical protein